MLRGDTPRELSPHWQGLRDVRRRLLRIVPWWLVLLLSAASMAAIYGGFSWVLSQERTAVLEQYQTLEAAPEAPVK